MKGCINVNGRYIGPGRATYIVAEMSANHGQNFDQAVRIIEAAKQAGADAVKVQTYTPDTMTIACDNDYFRIKGTIWEGKTLHDLYSEAFTPWDWQPRLQEIAVSMGLDFFSTPFDFTAVDFLESLNVPVHKIASFELVDLPLLSKIASTGKPVIMSTGMATLAEIAEAVDTLRRQGSGEIALLKCTSAYPALASAMHLRTIPHLADAFGVVVGLSDHTLGISVPVAAVAQGAVIVEKHLTLSRSLPGPDSAFSLEPEEFADMVRAIRETEQALGEVRYTLTDKETASRAFRRSLFVVQEVAIGEVFTNDNIRSIRPGYGLHPRYLEIVLGRRAAQDINRGTPLSWQHIGEESS